MFDKDGNLFIDQDPKNFVYVLNSLRTGCYVGVPKEALLNVKGIAEKLEIPKRFSELILRI